MKFYLAYGSNLNVYQMRHRCPTAKVVGTAWIEGYELLFKGSYSGSYLTIEKKEGSKVPVVVWGVERSDELSLDRYEGYPNFYYKQVMDISYTDFKTQAPKKCNAFVYIMHEERELGIPSNSYIQTCSIGYATFGFDLQFLQNAYNKSVEGVIDNER